MENKCFICGSDSDNLWFNYGSQYIPCICKRCKDDCESLIDPNTPRSRKAEAISTLTGYIENNPDMEIFVRDILRTCIVNAFIKKPESIEVQAKERKVKITRPNDFWTNIAALIIWTIFFILILAGAFLGYKFDEEGGLFFGALIGAIVGGCIVCFSMILIEISQNNAKQVDLLDDILNEIYK